MLRKTLDPSTKIDRRGSATDDLPEGKKTEIPKKINIRGDHGTGIIASRYREPPDAMQIQHSKGSLRLVAPVSTVGSTPSSTHESRAPLPPVFGNPGRTSLPPKPYSKEPPQKSEFLS